MRRCIGVLIRLCTDSLPCTQTRPSPAPRPMTQTVDTAPLTDLAPSQLDAADVAFVDALMVMEGDNGTGGDTAMPEAPAMGT